MRRTSFHGEYFNNVNQIHFSTMARKMIPDNVFFTGSQQQEQIIIIERENTK